MSTPSSPPRDAFDPPRYPKGVWGGSKLGVAGGLDRPGQLRSAPILTTFRTIIMPTPRIPVDKIVAKGSHLKNPALFADRVEPKVVPLGPPSPHLRAGSRVAWFAFVSELPWLAESDRGMLEMASNLRGRLIAGEDMPINALTLLRQCLQTLGATPADRSRVPAGDDPHRVVDPAETFFQ